MVELRRCALCKTLSTPPLKQNAGQALLGALSLNLGTQWRYVAESTLFLRQWPSLSSDLGTQKRRKKDIDVSQILVPNSR